MSAIKKIAKNTLFLFISQLINYLLIFFYFIYTARYLGASGFGILSFALSIAGIFGILADLGFNTLITRELARDGSLTVKYARNVLSIKFLLSIVTFGTIFLIINLLNYPYPTNMVIYLISLAFIVNTFTTLFYAIFQAFQNMGYQSLGQVLSGLFLLIPTLIAINYDLDIIALAFLYLLNSCIILLYILIIFSAKFKFPRFQLDFKLWKPLIIMALPLSFTIIFSTIAFRVDVVLLSILKGNFAVGLYSSAYKFIEALMIFPAVYMTSIYPLISSFHVSSKEYLQLSYVKSFKYLFILGLPIAIIITKYSADIILLFYKSDFIEASPALQILIWTIPIIFVTYMYGTLLVSINKQNLLLKILFIGMTFNILLNLIFIPFFSYIGAAWVTVISELISFALCLYYVSQLVCKIDIKEIIIKPVIAAIFMVIFIFYAEFNPLITIIISIGSYILILFILRTFSTEDMDLFKKVINIRRK